MEIVKLLTCEDDFGIQADAASCLQELFHGKDFFFAEGEHEPLTLLQKHDQEACLSVLYERSYLEWMVKPFRDSATCPNQPGANNAMIHMTDFLSNCVLNHGYRAKYFVLKDDLMGTIMQLCHRKEKILQIASVRFLLACIQVKAKTAAPFYQRYIVKKDLFKHVFECFFANPADDMLKASICHLVDFVGSENFTTLVAYIATQYGDKLRACTYCKDTFLQILKKYEYNLDFPNQDQFTNDLAGAQMSQQQVKFLENKHEESYFDEDDDDDAHVSPAVAAATALCAAPAAIILAGPPNNNAPRPVVDQQDENPQKRMKI